MEDKILPSENSDYSLPGRIEESNVGYEIPVQAKPKNRSLTIAGIAFLLVSAGFFSYYFINQDMIDSQIMDNTELKSIEEKMVIHYGVGEFGSDHAHAAIAVFVDDVQLPVHALSQLLCPARPSPFGRRALGRVVPSAQL